MRGHVLARRARRLCLIACGLLIAAASACAGSITSARYETPVDRYGHFALGRPHEYARVTATTDLGRKLTLELSEDEVFEDLAPRLVKLAADTPVEALVIISSRQSGARLALLGMEGHRLRITAQSAAIGTPMRWLNPVGIADMDGNGRNEIAAVITPHIGGTLKLYRRTGARLVEIAVLGGFSNHVYGSTELRLALPVRAARNTQLVVPDANRLALRVIEYRAGRLVEVGRCALPAAVTGELQLIAPYKISVDTGSQRRSIALDDCRL